LAWDYGHEPDPHRVARELNGQFMAEIAQPNGTLPFPWRLKNQTATFYKSAHPLRSAFRVEPLNGT